MRPETACVLTGEACEKCPFWTPNLVENACGNLAVGRSFQQLLEELNGLRIQRATLVSEKQSLALRLEREMKRRMDASEDTLIPGCCSPSGMRDMLKNDKELQQVLLESHVAVIYVDLRGQKNVNDNAGREAGDRYIVASHRAVTDNVAENMAKLFRVSSESQPIEERAASEERRKQPKAQSDHICSIGGDEFAVILTNISAADAQKIAHELQTALSVEQAISNYQNNPPCTPLIASVGVSYLENNEAAQKALDAQDFWKMFLSLCHEADSGHNIVKKNQYDEMWALYKAQLPENEHKAAVYPADERKILTMFLGAYCPDFIERPDQFLVPTLRN